jgi:hypothetical protein
MWARPKMEADDTEAAAPFESAEIPRKIAAGR